MTDPTGFPAAGDDADVDSDRESTIGMPRWVKVSLIVVAGLIVLFVVLQLTGMGGEHGPGRHMPGGGAPASSVGEDGGHKPPPGMDHGR